MDVNITLISILVIVLLFIPGFFFKRFYYSGKFTKQFHSGTFAERFITSVFWGIIVQFVSLALMGKFTTLQYSKLRLPITAFLKSLTNSEPPECTPISFNYIVAYIFVTVMLGIMLGLVTHNIVRILRLDIYIPVLRFSNYWNYYFKGDLKQLRGNRRKGKVISTNIDAIVDDGTGNKNKLYSGFLADYIISPITGDLETIVLSSAERWSESKNDFKSIPGDNLIIPYKTVLNLNVRYNIQSKRNREDLSDIFTAITLLAFLAVIFGMPSYFFHKIGIIRIIFATLLSVIDLLFLQILINTITPSTITMSQEKKTNLIIGSIFFILLLSISVYFLLKQQVP
jgi:hypothetical protein